MISILFTVNIWCSYPDHPVPGMQWTLSLFIISLQFLSAAGKKLESAHPAIPAIKAFFMPGIYH